MRGHTIPPQLLYASFTIAITIEAKRQLTRITIIHTQARGMPGCYAAGAGSNSARGSCPPTTIPGLSTPSGSNARLTAAQRS
jgi:hypothetical protein